VNGDRIRVRAGENLLTFDVRASDAYTLALICGAPIYIVEEAMERFVNAAECGDA
jgi:bifunctional DNase/RNase